MPIRINLLAEAQAAEELRRQDPVKRAVVIAVCLVALVAVWSLSLQFEVRANNAKHTNLQKSLASVTNEYQLVLDSQKKLADVNDHLKALNHLAAERTLTAPLLNALTLSSVEGIRLTHFNTDDAIETTAEIPTTKDNGRVIPGKPATAVERIKILLNGRDSSPNPGSEQINKFKDALARTDYFTAQKITTNDILLKSLSSPLVETDSGKLYVTFALECSYPDKTR